MKHLYFGTNISVVTHQKLRRGQNLLSDSITWRFSLVLLLLNLLTTGQAKAQTVAQVVAASPTRNAHTIATGASIGVTFSQSMSTAASAAGLRVFSSQHEGLLGGTYSGLGTATASFQPNTPFRAGETIRVYVPKTTSSSTGTPLGKAYAYQFTTATTPSPGTFAAPGITLPSGPNTYGVTTADYDGDGNLDMATSGVFTTDKVQVRLGQGNGNFGPSVDYAVGSAYFLTSADMDNDGDIDLLVATYTKVVVLLNDGHAAFTALPGFALGADLRTIVPADVDGDGNLDILVASQSAGAVFVSLGNGDGTFSPTGGSFLSVPAPVGLAVGDLDGDGDLDLVMANAQSLYAFVRLNDGNGNFSAGSTLTVVGQPNGIALGDLNGDGALDILVVNESASSVSILANKNDGKGSFQAATTVSLGTSKPNDIKVGDLDGDGDLDFVTGGQNMSMWRNNGSGTFTAGPALPLVSYYIALADLNNDGTLDLVAPNTSSAINVRLNLESPAITGFTPTSGPIGTTVTITGTHLLGTTRVTFNGTIALAFTVVSDVEVTATVPAGATTGRIVVTTLPGVTGTSPANYTVPAPVITTLTPDAGPAGTSVSIVGVGFSGTSNVTFNGLSASGFLVNPDGTQIQVAAPAGVTTGPVQVTTPSGTSNGLLFTGAPVLSSIAPAFGPAGTSTTIMGAGLIGATSVTFNGLPAPGFVVNATGTALTVNAPVGVTTGQVVVTTPNGTSNSYLQFTAAPTISDFTPGTGSVGTRVVVTGANFTGANQVKFGTVATTTFAVNSATQLSVTVPTGAATGPIQVRTAAGTATSATNYIVPAPTITAISPSVGGAYTVVTITGTDFTGATGVTFNGVRADYFYTNSATSITAYAPYGVTTGLVLVTTPAGVSNGLPFTAAPFITSFTPASGNPGTMVVIVGANFTGATSVSFNGVPAASFTVDAATQLTATVPMAATSGRLAVTTPAGTAFSNTSFLLTRPVITALTPDAGPAGTVVTITGTGFLGFTSVVFNGVAAPGAVVDATGTTLTVTAPVGATTGPVLVSNGGGWSNGVLFTSAATLAGLSPNFGPAGTQVTLTGSGLATTTQVTFNGVVAPGFTVNSAGTSLTVAAPAGVTTGPVAVTNAYGTTTGPTFTLPPTITDFTPSSSPIGSSIVVAGTDFTGATRVVVNTTTATSYTINSPSQLTVVVPAGATSGPVRITTPAGTATSPGNLTIPAPTLLALNPAAGPIGAFMTITGTSLQGATQVSFNGVLASSFGVNTTGTTLSVRVPTGATTGLVTVTTINGSSNGLLFTVGATITSISPNFGGPGTVVTLKGANFQDATDVTFNGVSAPGFTVNSDGTEITVSAPVGVRTGSVVVTTPIAASNGVLYTAAPLITAFTPATGLVGTSVTITGTDLNGTTQVLFNSVAAASVSLISSTQVRAVVPTGATTGPIQIVTTHGNGSSSTDFIVPAPVIASIAPAAGPVGSSVTLTGNGFQGTTAVLFNGVLASGFTVNATGTTLSVLVPTGATSGLVTITTPPGLSNGVSFAVLPAINSVSPAPAIEGQLLTIIGTTFVGATQISFNGVASTNFTVVSPTQITATVPTGAVSGLLRVTTAAGSSAGYQLLIAPTIAQVQPKPNASNVSLGANIAVNFSRAVNTAAASRQSVRAFSQQAGGLLSGSYSGSNSTQVVFDPSQDFRPGETIAVTVTTAAQAADGTAVNKPLVYQFTTAAAPAPGLFVGGGMNYPTLGNSYGITVGDFDKDGTLDMAAPSQLNSSTTGITIYYGSVRSTSAYARSYGRVTGPGYFLANADFDNDGDLDLLQAMQAGGIMVLSNYGSDFDIINTVPATTPKVIVPADVNGDGNLDLLVACADAGASVYLGNGTGAFSAGTVVATGRVLGLATGDVDGDGDLDLVVPDAMGNRVSIYWNNGVGGFATSTPYSVANSPIAVAVGDVNNDGTLDILAVQNTSKSVAVLLNGGTGTFTAGTTVMVGAGPTDIKLGDVDGDGDLDIATPSSATKSVSIALNNSAGIFAPFYAVSVGAGPYYVALGDMDLDGTLDLVTGNPAASPATDGIALRLNRIPEAVWTGQLSSDWFHPANWRDGLLPTSTDDTRIPGGLSRYPVVAASPVATPGTIATVRKLTIEPGASLTVNTTYVLEVSGDWLNHGATTLNGTVRFLGTGPQLLGGTALSSFAALAVDKATGIVSLQCAATVTSTLDMKSGLLVTNAHSLTTTGADLNESSTSYVLGSVLNTLATTTSGTRYTFGNLGVAVTCSGPVLPGSMTVTRVTGTALAGPGLAGSIQRYYEIQAATNTGLDVELELTYADRELNGLSEASLGLFRSSTGLTGPWEYVPSSSQDMVANKLSATGVQHFSVWTLGQLAGPLPVKLIAFSVEKRSTAVTLSWRTASEQNSDRFEIERSRDGHTFDRMGTVAAKGTTSQPTDYHFIDDKYPNEASLLYYRLRQVDADGTARYSPTRTVQLEKVKALALYPNPAHRSFTVIGASAGAKMEVIDAIGRLVVTGTAGADGTIRFTLPDYLQAGLYLVRGDGQVQRITLE